MDEKRLIQIFENNNEKLMAKMSEIIDKKIEANNEKLMIKMSEMIDKKIEEKIEANNEKIRNMINDNNDTLIYLFDKKFGNLNEIVKAHEFRISNLEKEVNS